MVAESGLVMLVNLGEREMCTEVFMCISLLYAIVQFFRINGLLTQYSRVV